MTTNALMQFFNNRIHGTQNLADLYDRGATRWHRAIQKMGYIQAYDKLCRLNASLTEHATNQHHSVLDVGTGTGGLALSFIKNTPVTAHLKLLDPSQQMLRCAAANLSDQKAQVQLIHGSIGTNILTAGNVETVLCAHVIEHTDDPLQSLKWMRSCLKQGGVLLLVVSKPHWCTALVRWKWGHRAFRPDDVVHLLESSGFTRVQTVPFEVGPPSRMSFGYRAMRL